MKVRRFDRICIAVKNLEEARKQYEEILGIEPDILYNVNPLPAMRALFFADKYSDKTKFAGLSRSTTRFFVHLTCPKASSYPKKL